MSHPLGYLGVTYALHLWLVGKPMVDFIFVVIELFSVSLIRLRRYERKSVEVGVFRSGVGHFGEYLTGKGHRPRPPTIVGVRKLE